MEQPKNNKLSPYTTGLIQGVLIGISFCIAIVALGMYFGSMKGLA